ncbi:NUDIX hydrolase [Streptomyces sp. NPDC005931]|uniref:NUDIX hydrolase n=1 Tax=Streptomyces sp. NPDC005931 TaxID=3364737 RepID=UPI0036B72D72
MDSRARLTRYQQIREALPDLFVNPPDAPVEILTDTEEIGEAETEAMRRSAAHGHPPEWGHLGVVFEDPYGITLRDAVRGPNGQRGTYIRRINPGNAPGVVILPQHPDGIILIRHFRHSTREWHLEFPRGFGTPGGRPDADARRELLEEIGARADTLTSLGVVHPDTGQTATSVHLYHAEISEYRLADEDEGIGAVEPVSPGELTDLIRTGTVTDGFTIAAYTRALLQGLLPTPD